LSLAAPGALPERSSADDGSFADRVTIAIEIISSINVL